MERLRVGVIGAGNMGQNYIKVYQTDLRTEVVAVCERNPGLLEEVGGRLEVERRYTSHEEMLGREKLDLVCVATPDHTHFAPCKTALEAGAHVLCEKPFTTDLKEADELCAIEKSSGKRIQVSYTHRWLPPYYRTRMAVEQGEIGEPVAGYARKNDPIFVATDMINWASESTPSMFLSGHDIDLMRWYFGSEAVEAHGYGTKKVLVERGIDTYDIIQAQVKFASGAYATFEACWIYANTYATFPDSFVEVIGTRGHIYCNRETESMTMATEEKYSFPKTGLYGEVYGKIKGAFASCLESCVDAILEDRPPCVTSHDGRQVTAILCAIDQAVRTGATVKVE